VVVLHNTVVAFGLANLRGHPWFLLSHGQIVRRH